MASSDDEGETVPQSVANYDFVDEKDEPVSFAALPIKWSELESPDGMTTQMFLHGTADSGLQKVYKQVSAWKFELSCEQPEISVLSKENRWIKLQKPRKSFEETIRTILITLHCLHFAKKNTETSAKSLWDHLLKVFSLYEVPPSENDLLNHWRLMSEAVKRDETLSKCKFLTTFVEEKPRKRKPFDEVFQAPKKKFIVDDDDEDESDEEGDLFDSVCAICDNGGELLCCEGRCMRSFHATVDAGSESLCKSLGFSDDQVEAIQNFLCLNCQYKQHQCFACGTLGSSDKSLTAEVFPCVSATCGHFYHPECAAKLLHPGNETAAEELEKKIAAGQPFICPVHKCLVCKQGENKKVHELQFAVCRRCPKAYHRKCLPRKIAFEDSEDGDIIQRAWEGLMPNRILIYCLKHKIEDDIGTPVRNHIKFPEDKQKREKCPTELQRNKEKALAKKRRTVSEDSYGEKTAVKAPELVPKVSSAGKDSGSTKKISRTGSDSFTKSTILDLSRKSSKGNSKPTLMRDKSFTADERKVSLGEDELNSQLTKGLEPQFKPKQLETSGSKLGKKKTAKPVTKKLGSSHTLLDADAEKRIMDLMKDVSSSITLDKILQNHELPSTHAYSWKHMVDKTITLGKVEVSVEAVRTALQKLEEGCSIDDARDVCEPEILKQIIKWKNKLKVYLAPFLYGLRYTSYGRHFTKVGKLKEIVDWLHWYVQNGDTIVDFCCGANDFSCLMKKKLEETGKKCSFKNYDLIQPKNDFNFEKRDWMSVHPRELPTGSQLIMGLNPPFGVKASLANKFINKALEFKPKLIILIVPKETERLDEKEAAYDLIWEDGQKLSGKSFYLPGSVDVNDKQMEQWNQKPPPLYLWSRPDWTTKHKAIAQKHGHMVTKEELHADENRHDTKVSDNPKEADDDCCADISKLINDYGDDSRSLDFLPEQIGETEKSEEARAAGSKEKKKGLHSNIGNKGGKSHDQGNKRSREDSVDWGDKHKHARGKAEALAAKKQDGDRSPQVSERYKEIPPTISSPNRRSLLSHSLEELETPSERALREGNYSQFHPSGAGMGSNGHGGIQTSSPEEMAKRYGGIQNSISEDIVRRYSRNSEDPLPSGTNNWSTGLRHGYEYGLRSIDETNPSYLRDNADVFGRTSYGGELDEKYRREADIRAQLRLYGRQEADPLSQRSSTYLTSQGSGFGHMGSLSATAYGRIGSASESSSYDRMGLSAMQRYAPQLDELNRARMSNLGSGISPVSRSGIYDRPGSVPGLLANSMGFAPGPQRPFSDHNSSGWLND